MQPTANPIIGAQGRRRAHGEGVRPLPALPLPRRSPLTRSPCFDIVLIERSIKTVQMTLATRDRLVQTAMRLFWEKGFGSTSVADLLQAAGVPREHAEQEDGAQAEQPDRQRRPTGVRRLGGELDVLARNVERSWVVRHRRWFRLTS